MGRDQNPHSHRLRAVRTRVIGLSLSVSALFSVLMLSVFPASAAMWSNQTETVVLCSPDGPKVLQWNVGTAAEPSSSHDVCADCPVCPPTQTVSVGPATQWREISRDYPRPTLVWSVSSWRAYGPQDIPARLEPRGPPQIL